MDIWIYAGFDPRPQRKGVYVGKSRDPEGRWASHEKEARAQHRTPKQLWICELLDQGLKPRWELIELVEPGASWQERERFWIACYKSEDYHVYNLTRGGEGWDITSAMWHSDEFKETRERHVEQTRRAMERLSAQTATCELCGRSFQGAARLKYHHTMMHTDYRDVRQDTRTCEVCGTKCKGGLGLSSHMRTHTPEGVARRAAKEAYEQRVATRQADIEKRKQEYRERTAASVASRKLRGEWGEAVREDRRRFPRRCISQWQRQRREEVERDQDAAQVAAANFAQMLRNAGRTEAQVREMVEINWPGVILLTGAPDSD